MKKFIKENKAITLIALVITIVILIILAGVLINITLGDNGLFNKAKTAKKMYINAEEDENDKINALASLFEDENDNLPENTPSTVAGTKVKVPSNWTTETVNYIKTSNGEQATVLTKVATVYAVSVGGGETVPVPKGFYYVGGDLESGVIISDAEADKYIPGTDKTTHSYRKNLQGNQFVWIPCDIDHYNFVTTYSTDSNGAYGYNRVPGEIAQIEKYGGYYVGRYEAGICIPTGENNSCIATADILNGTTAVDWHSSEFITETVKTTGKPIVKAGAIPWYQTDYITSAKVAENMYKGNQYVTSGLLTGTMWDQMIVKIGDANTTTAGNYSNSTYTTEEGIYHATCGEIGAESWSTTSASKSNGAWWMVETGMLNTYARYNIYDTAGNVWEWTEQNSSYTSKKIAYAQRGGDVTSNASNAPASVRYCDYDNRAGTVFGFRVALYLK